jgi:cell division protein FtsB
MDIILEAKINNTINEINNQLEHEHIDNFVARTLMSLAVNRISLLMTHIGYLENKLQSTLDSNKMMTVQTENLIAENQRLSQIAKY